MLNNVVLMGYIKERVNEDTRLLEVERDYKDNNGNFSCDKILIKYWSKSSTCTFMNIKSGAHILVKGRLETSEDNRLFVVVESFDYLSSNNF